MKPGKYDMIGAGPLTLGSQPWLSIDKRDLIDFGCVALLIGFAVFLGTMTANAMGRR